MILLHDLTDNTPEHVWVELPDGSSMPVKQYRAKVLEAAKVARVAIDEARAKRRRQKYIDEAIF